MILFVAGFAFLWCSWAKLLSVKSNKSAGGVIFDVVMSLLYACAGGWMIGIGAGIK